MSASVYLGLGSNLAQPSVQLDKAVKAIAALPELPLRKLSAKYVSPPLDGSAQPDYVNQVLVITTTLSPLCLLEQLQAIEIAQGRPAIHAHWGARIIDIDILLYDTQVMQTPELTIPHPGLVLRAFVVLPLLSLAPGLCLPNGELLASYRDIFPSGSLKVLSVKDVSP